MFTGNIYLNHTKPGKFQSTKSWNLNKLHFRKRDLEGPLCLVLFIVFSNFFCDMNKYKDSVYVLHVNPQTSTHQVKYNLIIVFNKMMLSEYENVTLCNTALDFSIVQIISVKILRFKRDRETLQNNYKQTKKGFTFQLI